MAENFKTCMFGGFDRQSVVDYIGRISRDNRDKVAALQDELAVRDAEIGKLRLKNDQLSGELSLLRKMTGETELAKDENQDLRHQIAELRVRVTELETENQTLRTEHLDYQTLKNHIADIEIRAHRDCEAFRAAAIAQMKESIDHQREWNSEMRKNYTQMNETLCQQLRDAENALCCMDLSGFDHMEQELQEMEENLGQ